MCACCAECAEYACVCVCVCARAWYVCVCVCVCVCLFLSVTRPPQTLDPNQRSMGLSGLTVLECSGAVVNILLVLWFEMFRWCTPCSLCNFQWCCGERPARFVDCNRVVVRPAHFEIPNGAVVNVQLILRIAIELWCTSCLLLSSQ